MAWCPKCETEYREGIFICADCGSELVDELPAKENTTYFPEEEVLQRKKEEENVDFFEETKNDAMERRKQLKETSGIYVESSKKAEDYRSGAVSLLGVGGIGLVVIVLILLDIIPVSMNLFSKYLILGVMGALFLLFIIMGILSVKSYKTFEVKASKENNLTRDLTLWCKENIKPDIMDADAEEESEELKYFRRTEKMKEMISGEFLNLDAAFLESFIDDIYPEIFE